MQDDSGGITVEEFEVMLQRLNAGLSRSDIHLLVEWIKKNYTGDKADKDDFVISEDELKCVINVERLMTRAMQQKVDYGGGGGGGHGGGHGGGGGTSTRKLSRGTRRSLQSQRNSLQKQIKRYSSTKGTAGNIVTPH